MFMMVSRVFAFLAHSWRILGYILGTSRGPPGDHAEPRKHQECTKNANIYFYNGFHSWCILGAFLVYLPGTSRDLPGTSREPLPRMHRECTKNAPRMRNSSRGPPGNSRELPGTSRYLPDTSRQLPGLEGAGGQRHRPECSTLRIIIKLRLSGCGYKL